MIIQPDIISDQKRYIEINKEYKDLSKVIKKIEAYQSYVNSFGEAKDSIKSETDAEMIEMAKSEIEEAQMKLPLLEEEIKMMLVPKDPEDAKNVMVEIRAGTGGDEASIFAGDLYRMYTEFLCQSRMANRVG